MYTMEDLDFPITADCYGISQDPVTKSYVIVMKYMRGGNLRQFLQNNYNMLCIEDKSLLIKSFVGEPVLGLEKKLRRLSDIATGLLGIHSQNLVHRDFHSGNILNTYDQSYISDLGFCHLTNYQNQEGQ